MKKTKMIAVTAVLAALYFVLSALLKIPVGDHITLELGYIVLMVGAVYLGAIPAAFIGGIGVLVESALMSQHGISPGWILMNVIVGLITGFVLHKTFQENRKKFVLSACITVPLAVLLGVFVKMIIDCLIYQYAPTLKESILIKIGPTAAAWIADTLVMLAIGMPVSLALKSKLKL